MKSILIILSFLFFTNCSYTNTKYASNEIETRALLFKGAFFKLKNN